MINIFRLLLLDICFFHIIGIAIYIIIPDNIYRLMGAKYILLNTINIEKTSTKIIENIMSE
jgi:hypothetical protein